MFKSKPECEYEYEYAFNLTNETFIARNNKNVR